MEINKFIENVVMQFEDIDGEGVTENSNIRDIEGWSSLVAFSIIAMVEEEYNVVLKGDDILKSKTIRDIYDIVKVRKSVS